MRVTGYGPAVAATLMLVGCQAFTEKVPTRPTETGGSKILNISIPTVTLPTPTPPPPTPPPTTPTPPPVTGKCGQPLPPEVSRMNVKIHIRGPNKYTLDVTPLVGPDGAYCKSIGFTDGRLFCAVRQEGDPQRIPCEEYAVGYAEDTKRQGPTWYLNGSLCTPSKCENHEDNQYLLYAYAGGRYEACAKNDVCGAVDVDR